MSRRIAWVVALLFAVPLCAGCWDRTELEQRGFVTGVAIDEGSEKINQEQSDGMQKFKITFHEAIPAGLKQDDQTGSLESGKSFFNISMEGRTMLSTIARLTTVTSRTPFFEHLKLIIISEKVARTEYGFANVLDYFLRNNDARRNVLVMIAEGEAKEVLETMPQGEKTPVEFVHSIAQNIDSLRMLRESRIGEVHERLLKRESFAVQRVRAEKNFISLGGSAIMDGGKNRLVGFLSELQTQGLNFIKRGMQQGVIEARIGDNLVSFQVERINRKINADVSDPRHPRFHIQISAEGIMLETFERLDYLGEPTIADIQQKIEAKIASLALDTIAKVQKEYRKDALGLGVYLKQNKPQTWKLVKSEWDHGSNYFSKSEIDVTVTAKIRRIGSVNNTESRGGGE